MTGTMVGPVLCLIHVSLVAATTLIVRVCIWRQWAASRAAIGGVGMACILLVTALAFCPLPNLLPRPSATLVQNKDAAGVTGRKLPAAVSVDDAAKGQSAPVSGFEAGFAIPRDWFWRVERGLGVVTTVADSAPRGSKYLLMVCFLCGSGVGAVRLLWALRGVRQLYQASSLIGEERVVSMLDALRRDSGCHRAIELRQTDQLACAATFGLFQPVILLPPGWTEWSQEELAAGLAHEVAHICRGDYLQRLVARLGEAIYFFHPLVRAAAHQLTVDQEFAADGLASRLQPDEQAYLRGLARMAIRCHDSFQDERAGSSVSIMPKSSDFLARRLEMLRTKRAGMGTRTERFVSYGAVGSVMIIALAVTLLRSPTFAADQAGAQAAKSAVTGQPNGPAGQAASPIPVDQKEDPLFARAPFDLSIIPNAEQGAFLIRTAALLQLAEAQPLVDGFNQVLTKALREWAKAPEACIDLRQIEWIAGGMIPRFEAPKEKGGKAFYNIRSPSIVIQTVQARKWQDVILKHVNGASLKTAAKGECYVELPVIPAWGPGCIRLQFLDDKRIVAYLPWTKVNGGAVELEEHDFRSKPAQQLYGWADAWRAVEGGLVTIAYDHRHDGWTALPAEKRNFSAFVTPLLEKVNYYAAGCDWSQASQRMGIQVRGTCSDEETVGECQLAASMLLNQWPDLFLHDAELPSGGDLFEKHHKRILQFFSSVQIKTSPLAGEHYYVHATAAGTLSEQELVRILFSIK